MNLLQITGAVRDGGSKKLEKLLATLDQDRARNTSQRVLEGTRQIGESHESITAALEEANRALPSVRGAEEALGRARTALSGEFEARRTDRSELVAMTALVEQTTEELGGVRQREAELQRRLSPTEDALAESRAGRLQAEVEDTEVRRQEAETQAASSLQARNLMDVEKGVLERRVESLTGEFNRASRTVADLESQLAGEKSRARTLEATAQSASAEAERLGRQLEEQAEKSRSQLEMAELRMETAQARTLRLEEDNAELTRQLRDAVARDRLGERDSGEMKLRLKQAEDQIASLAADLLVARKDLASVEAARAAAVDRSDRLTETAEARLADIQRLEQQIEVVNGRYDLLVQEANNERAAADVRAKTLSAAIERERSERHLASGALEAARKDRARLHMEVLKSGRGNQTPAEAPLVGAPEEQVG